MSCFSSPTTSTTGSSRRAPNFGGRLDKGDFHRFAQVRSTRSRLLTHYVDVWDLTDRLAKQGYLSP